MNNDSTPLLDVRNLTVVRGGVQVLDVPSLSLHEIAFRAHLSPYRAFPGFFPDIG